MKVLPFIIPKPEQAALVFQEDHELIFYDKFHQHKEIQISLIIEGEGTLIVGDTINYYKTGDVLVIGSNLPHVFKSDVKKTGQSHMLTLFFTEDAFGKDFFKLEDLKELDRFFKRAAYGFKVKTHENNLELLFYRLKDATKLSQFILLFEILNVISKQTYESLSSFIYDKKYNDIEGKRMRDVMEYTMNNFHNEITLENIATMAAMTKNAFCKYFKKRTNKTYFTFLNELRIENACKLLQSDKGFTISQIADKSGFNSISNFNRQFKAIKHMNPMAFKRDQSKS
ncbi:AraC family transcriptional regulator [Spongiimicrobium salis]|uniref:AraC family transcriptional regulator n=1 Tax=Spongiimicrobium salis TaxID=1667022 RepID=UPI00374D5FD0